MHAAAFAQFLQEKGSISVPCWLLEKYQAMDIKPEELGYLLLALHQRAKADGADAGTTAVPYMESGKPGVNYWTGWALEQGWAKWSGEEGQKKVAFDPLWQKLYRLWESEREAAEREKQPQTVSAGDFDYSKIVKELDRLRGNMSVTVREQQLIQEFHIKYGWSTDFMLNFFRLCSQRKLMQIKNYKPLAERIHRSGIFTLEGLASYMNEVDWIGKQAEEIKKDYLGLYGMVTIMERDYYVKWHVTWRFSHALIVRAAQESSGVSNATFKYIDTILTRWHDLDVRTPEACEEAIRLWREERKSQIQAGSGARTRGKTGGRRAEKERGDSPWDEYTIETEGGGEKT